MHLLGGSWESEDARAIDGAEALFGPFYDFGYSKSGSDTVSKWGRKPRRLFQSVGRDWTP